MKSFAEVDAAFTDLITAYVFISLVINVCSTVLTSVTPDVTSVHIG